MNYISKIVRNPDKVMLYLMEKGILNWMNDKTYLKIKYKLEMGKRLDIDNPKDFNEKLQWLKVNNRKDEYTTMVDKYEAKGYIERKIGQEYIIKNLGVWDKFEDIDFNILPNKFVLKPTHTSGNVFICKDKSKIDYKKLKKEVRRWLKRKYYYIHREWPYKNIKPRVIAEEYKEDNSGGLIDYKLYSFNGKCDYVMTCIDREKKDVKTKFIYYDKNWNLQKELSKDGKEYGGKIKVEKPKNLEKMFEIAGELSKGIPFVRVDFYEVDGKLYFGELTFFPSAGFDNKRTQEMQEYLDKNLVI